MLNLVVHYLMRSRYIMKFLPSLIFRLFTLAIFSSVVVAQLTNTSEGKLDKSFGINGYAGIGTVISWPGDALVLPDGTTFQVHSRHLSKLALVVSKQLPNGNVDASFGQNGLKSVEFATNFFATAIAVQPDGKIVAGGFTALDSIGRDDDFRIVRLMANGDLDTTFGTNGVVTIDFAIPGSGVISSDGLSSLLIQADGKIVAGGLSNQYLGPNVRTPVYSTLIRLNTNGETDLSFGTQGVSKVPVGNQSSSVGGRRPVILKSQADGKMLAGVTAEQESSSSPGTFNIRANLLRYLSDGSLDNSFSNDGMVDVSVAINAIVSDFAVLDDGKILSLTPYHLVRLNPNGTFDQTFGEGGQIPVAMGLTTNSNSVGLAVTGTGKIIISLFGSRTNRFIGALDQYWPDGTRDLRFGNNGRTIVEVPNQNVNIGRMTVIAGKDLIVHGLLNMGIPFTSRFSINRKR